MGRNYSLGSGARNNTESNALGKTSRTMYIATVLPYEDTERAGRIKVRIKGLDDKKLDSELPIVWPFLPLYINIVPKIGETVKIILYDSKNDDSYREYIGPMIPQLGEKLLGTNTPEEARAGREGEIVPFFESIKFIPTAEGVYPKEEEIAIQGRNNADLVFKDSEVMIRAAKFLPKQPNVKNDKNPAYIQIKTLNPGKYTEDPNIDATSSSYKKNFLAAEKDSKTRTDIKMVSNKIYLVGRDSSSSVVKPFMTDEEQSTIEKNLHPIVYGDILKDFIERLFKWIQTHTHAYHNVPQNPAVDSFVQLQLWKLNELPKLNSKNIFAGGDIPRKQSNIDTPEQLNNQLNEDVIERDNNSIVRGDGDEGPTMEWKGSKFTLEGMSRIDLQLIDLASAEVLKAFSSEGTNMTTIYTDVMSQAGIYMIEQKINPLKIKLPQLDDLENF